MVSSKHVDLFWELNLESHEETDGLKRVVTAVDVVSEEDVVTALDVALLRRNSPKIEEAHKILVLAMDVTENLDGRVNAKYHRLLLKDLLTLIGERDDVLSAEGEVARAIELGRPLSRPE
jgi:hypothetical protein